MPREMPPDLVLDDIIQPEVARCARRVYGLLAGTEEEYDNLQQVIEESLWAVYDQGRTHV